MRQIRKEKYNQEYFNNTFQSINYSKVVKIEDFRKVYEEIAELEQVLPNDLVVDYGCGNGDLSFYLNIKYHCYVVGIDYSLDAIKICNSNLKRYKKWNKDYKKISFQNNNNNNLPNFTKHVSLVYFCDVLEHMHDQEIFLVLKKTKEWNKKSRIKILVHTDNDIYLRFIRPIFDFLSILFCFFHIRDIERRNKWEKERHVNLTNPRKLTKKIKQCGYKKVFIKYPEVTKEKINQHLGKMQSIPFLRDLIYLFLKNFSFLNPSFYAVYTESKY